MRKNTRLSTPAQLQCSRAGAYEPGNEATCHRWLHSVYDETTFTKVIVSDHTLLEFFMVVAFLWLCPQSGKYVSREADFISRFVVLI